jgi:hypothetical protein
MYPSTARMTAIVKPAVRPGCWFIVSLTFTGWAS